MAAYGDSILMTLLGDPLTGGPLLGWGASKAAWDHAFGGRRWAGRAGGRQIRSPVEDAPGVWQAGGKVHQGRHVIAELNRLWVHVGNTLSSAGFGLPGLGRPGPQHPCWP